MGLGTILSGLQGVGDAKIGWNEGVEKGQAREAALRQHMLKEALELAAKRQTQSNLDRNYNLSQSRLTFEQGKKTPQERISARVSELVSKGTPLLEASKQARLEFGETNPLQYGTDEYIRGAVAVTKAREAAKPPRAPGGRTSDPNSPVRASQRERYLSQLADRAMEAAGGDVNGAATALVQEPATANIFSQGMSASHLNAAASRWKLRNMGKGRSAVPTTPRTVLPSKGSLDSLVAPPSPRTQATTQSQQQRDWDEAAAALRKRGDFNPEATLRARPQR